jgi:hypothetical protein
MYHTIEFNVGVWADLEIPGRARLERVLIGPGARLRARVKPYVVESSLGPAEVADLILEDDSIARTVSFACFRFAEDEPPS